VVADDRCGIDGCAGRERNVKEVRLELGTDAQSSVVDGLGGLRNGQGQGNRCEQGGDQ
jgi:hypothetical protein